MTALCDAITIVTVFFVLQIRPLLQNQWFTSFCSRYSLSHSSVSFSPYCHSKHCVYLAHLREKTKVRKVLIREMLFADDVALTAHTVAALQRLISSFAHACSEFGLTICLKKTNILCQDVITPSNAISDYTPEVVEGFHLPRLHNFQLPLSRLGQ